MIPEKIQEVIKKRDKKERNPGLNVAAMARQDQRLMESIVAPEGMEFVGYDYFSLEPAVSAEFSKDPLYTYATQTGIGKKPVYDERLGVLMVSDVYQLFGSGTQFMGEKYRTAWDKHNFYDLWLKDSEAVKNHPDIKPLRKFSKVCVLGIERGMGATKLKKDAQEKAGMEITMAVARQCIKDFWNLFSGLEALKTHLSNQALEHGAFITPLGFRVPCDDYKAYPFFTQAVANDCIMLYRTYYQDLAPWAQIITPIHDELVYMRPIACRDEDTKAHEQALELTNKTLKWGTPLRMSCSYGPTFYDIK